MNVFVTLLTGILTMAGPELPPGVFANDMSGTRYVMANPDGILIADGKNEQAYLKYREHGYLWQVPEFSTGRPHKVQHIVQVYDETLKKHVFEFHAHIAEDDDFCLPDRDNRQRVELATAGKHPSPVVAGEGQTLKMSWYFQLARDIKPSSKFWHVHQLKGIANIVPNDISMPILTFSCNLKPNGAEVMQVVYKAPHSNDNEYLATVPLKEVAGEWLYVEEDILCARKGRLNVMIRRVRDGKVLVDLKDVERDFWRDNCSIVHPKWGIYRSIGEHFAFVKDGSLHDETARFADFRVHNTSFPEK